MKRLYVMVAPSLLYRHKIGIAKDAERRRKSIDKSVSGAVWKIWVVLPPRALKTETLMHRALNFWNAPIKKKDGKTNGETEWFWTVNLITLSFLFLFAPSGWWYVALLPIPFDTIISVTVIILWGWLLRAGIVAGILFIIYNYMK